MRSTTLSIIFVTAAAGPGTRAAPFGAARLASALKARPELAGRVSARVLEGLSTDSPEALAELACAHEPDIVGLSLYSWNTALIVAAAALVKARFPGALIVAGGPEASAEPSRFVASGGASGGAGAASGGVTGRAASAARSSHVADIVVVGEGEEAMADIVRARLEGTALPGPVVRAPLLDPAGLASPWLDGTLDPARFGGAAVELTRGCPYRCAFCFESKGQAALRRFPLETVAAELEAFEKAGVEEVFVLDPTFNADAKRMARAVRLFGEKGPSLRYFLELRAELLTAEQAKLLSSIDCSVQIGLQSADPAVLLGVDRKFDPDQFSRKLRFLDEEGIVYGLDLIYGLPGDSLAGFKRSLDYALGLGPNHLDVFRLAVLPGTALRDRAASLGLEYDPEAPHLVRSSPGFGAADLADAERLAVAADVMYNRGRAVMWFRPVAILAKARPSTLLARFADYLDGSRAPAPDAPHRVVEESQLGFLRAMFADKPPKAAGAAEAALDLVRVSGAWTRAFAEGERTELELGWDPEELLDYAMSDLAEFASDSPRRPGAWLCEPSPDGPRFRKPPKGGTSRGKPRV
jgi:radical SAM superfamily enzyme YgiQ (UPF0313 family)